MKNTRLVHLATLIVLTFMSPLYGTEITPDGKWSEYEISASWLLAAPHWARKIETNSGNFKAVSATAGTLTDSGKTIQFQTTSTQDEQGEQQFSCSLSSSNFPELGHVAYELNLPLDKLQQLTINDKNVAIPHELNNMILGFYPEKMNRISIVMQNGTINLEGNFSLMLQDNRRWSNTLVLRLNGQNGKKSGEYKLCFRLKVQPRPSTVIPLNEVVNMGFRDDVASDGRGGWTDQGAGNDMRLLPPGKLSYGGVNFQIIDPARNHGQSCLVLSAAQKKFPDTATVKATSPDKQQFLYLLHAAAWVPQPPKRIGSITVTYDDGKQSTLPVLAGIDCGNWWVQQSYENAGIAWESTNFEARIGLYASAFRLNGKPTEIKFQAEGNAVWMICAASLANHGTNFVHAEGKVVFKAGKEWLPIQFSRYTEPGSPLDFSGMLEAPAGKFGQVITNPDGHFVFEKQPDKRIRFLGVNICETANYLTRSEADAFIDQIARIGYNSVRFHHFENLLLAKTDSGIPALDSTKLDQLHYLMAGLKKRGIYYTLDLYASRRILAMKTINETKLRFNFDPAAMQNWKTFVSRLMTAKNPYTGLSLAEDPALYVINLVNEDNLSFHLPREADSDLAKEFKLRWQQYLKNNPVSPVPSEGSGLYQQFLNELERARIREQTAFLRNEIKTRVLITDLNFISNYALNGIRSELQVVDMHAYWDHMRLTTPNKWYPPLHFSQLSALGQGAAHVREAMPARVFGLPFILTEVNYCFPNRYRVEYGPMFGAYAGLQDWDGIYRFQWIYGKEGLQNTLIGGFDIAKDPAAQLAERLLHSLFIRGDIAPACGGVAIAFQERALAAMDEQKFTSIQAASKEFSFLGLFTRIGVLPEGREFAGLRRIDLTGSWQKNLTDQERKILAAALNNEQLVSSTNEITLSARDKTLSVVTSRTEALCGTGKLNGKILQVAQAATPQTFALTSLDGKPLADSRKLLLLHLVNLANSGQTFSNHSMTLLEHYGTAPLLLEKAQAELSLRLPQTMKVETLDFSGRVTGDVTADYREGSLHFRVDTALRPHGVMAYLIRK